MKNLLIVFTLMVAFVMTIFSYVLAEKNGYQTIKIEDLERELKETKEPVYDTVYVYEGDTIRDNKQITIGY